MSTSISTIGTVALQRAVYVQRSGKRVAMATLVLDDADGIDLSCLIDAGHLPVGVREELIDAIFAVPEVQARRRIRATIPLGDTSLLNAIRDHCRDIDTRRSQLPHRRDDPADASARGDLTAAAAGDPRPWCPSDVKAPRVAPAVCFASGGRVGW
jgi:hypothetical protein